LSALLGAIDQHVGNRGTLLAPRAEAGNARVPYRLSWLLGTHLRSPIFRSVIAASIASYVSLAST
jgi:hypothetical protein